ncbi:MAG: hypothetical protein QME49_01415 [bacterium]|nr:hypothetical protein [bacterium]
MGVLIREADLDRDEGIMTSLLNENRRVSINEKRYEWLYKQNPHGKAIGWIAIDEKSDDPVGVTVVTPRLVRVEGRDVVCWNCGDFSIDKKYRSLGVAVKLRKAARDGVNAGIVPFLYAHPNDRMLVVHQRVGHPVMGQMVRYAKVIRLNKKIQEILKTKVVADVISGLGNPLLKLMGKEQWYRKGYTIDVGVNIKYGEEFDAFFDKVINRYAVCVVRNAEYLNWRYSNSPLYEMITLSLRKKGKLCGYLIYYKQEMDVVHVKDVFYEDDDAARHLIGVLISMLRRQGISTISLGLLGSNPFIEILRFFGFSQRVDISSVIVYPNPSFEYAETVKDAKNWFMMVGDRDV